MAESHDVFHTPPPHANGASHAQASGTPVAYTAVSSAAQAIGNTAQNEYIIICATTDCHIRFGKGDPGAATANDMIVPAKQFVRFDLRKDQEDNFRVIRDSADGTLYWYRASGG